MANLTDVPQFAAPAWVIFKRLAYHCASAGRLLDGLKWFPVDTVRVETVNTLPSLQVRLFTMDSKAWAGAPPLTAQKGVREANVPFANDCVMRLELATDIKDGFVRTDPTAAGRKGHYEWLGLVMDAIETNTLGNVDSRLEETVGRPIQFSIKEGGAMELTFVSIIEIIYESRPQARGQRSYTFPVLP